MATTGAERITSVVNPAASNAPVAFSTTSCSRPAGVS